MYKGRPYFRPSRQNPPYHQNPPQLYPPPSMTRSDLISSRLPNLALPEMMKSQPSMRSSHELQRLLVELENKLYNQHLQFHFMSVQTADIHSKVISLMEMMNSVEPNSKIKHGIYQKDYLTVFLEKLTRLVKEDSIDFEQKIKKLNANMNAGPLHRYFFFKF